MTRRPFVNVFVLAAALIIGAGPYVVRAAGFTADAGLRASVDIQRVYADSDARKAAEERVREFSGKLHDKFEEIQKLQYLAANEISDYSVAINAEKPTPADTKRMADLRAASAARSDEFQMLSAKANSALTQKDKDRLKELNQTERDRPHVIDVMQKFYQGALDEEDAKQHRVGLGEVRAIVGKLAKDQGITEVFDTSSLVYSPVDLTEQALHKTQAKPKLK